MMNFVYTLCSSTPGQIQYGGFKRALAKKSGDMIRHQVRILYLLFLWNSLNRTGTVNFNKYGQQDGIGFSPCSDKFVDNFLFYVYVPDYFVTTKKTYTEVGHVNKHIRRDMLTGFGFGKCEVKAVALSP